jgi:hypothetical protein
MPSFKTLAFIATFAFATFAGASPMPAPCASIGNCTPAPPPPPPSPCSTGTCNPKPLPDIFGNCHSALEPLTKQLIDLKLGLGVDIKAKVTPIITNIKAVIKIAIDDVNACAGHSQTTILTVGAKVWAVVDVAALIGKVLVLLFGAFGKLISTCGILRYKIILPLLVEVAAQISVLLDVTFKLVPGISGSIIAHIAGVLNVILFLNVGSLLKCLNLTAALGLNLGLGLF